MKNILTFVKLNGLLIIYVVPGQLFLLSNRADDKVLVLIANTGRNLGVKKKREAVSKAIEAAFSF
jgi:hypothetical protein